MKKILLIIAITFCIFQMIVLATAIDIGLPAIERSSAQGGYYTRILKDNPANETGTITSIEIYANSDMGSVEVATFFEVSATLYSTRDTHTIGTVTAGAKRTFEVDLDVEAGDLIGIYWVTGNLWRDMSGFGGFWSADGDKIPCTDVYFAPTENFGYSLYGTGTTEEEEAEVNVINMGTNF